MRSQKNHSIHQEIVPGYWLSLSEAAKHLGVHYTTLRRWSDTGKIPCMRTPGGRRRFLIADLQNFIAQSKIPYAKRAILPVSEKILLQDKPVIEANKIIEHEPWLDKIGEVERIKFNGIGQMMLSLMMQYIARTENDDPFLKEGEEIAVKSGTICAHAGLSITETLETFLLFRKSILKMLLYSNTLNGSLDETGKRLHERANDYLDALLVATIHGYSQAWLK